MSAKLVNEWSNLDTPHKQFVLRVRDGMGGKHAASPCSIDSEERHDPPNDRHFKSIALWEKTESLGFIVCTGSFRWVTTAKFSELEDLLFGIKGEFE